MNSKDSTSKPFVFPVMKKAIESLFTRPQITKEDIESFQDRYWEQLVPNFSQALKLLDIHGVSRHSILWSINDRLLDAIKTNVDAKTEDPDQRKCQKLWQKLIKTGMVYIHHPYMRSLIMQVLGKMNSIKERHVNLIVDNQYLYDDAPLPVLRHIWVAHPHKFREELDKVITLFQNNWSEALLDTLQMAISAKASSTADLVPLLYWPPRRRRRDAAIVRIVEMVGDGQALYDKIVAILQEECLRSERAAAQLMNASAVPAQAPIKEPASPPPKRRRRLDSTGSNSSSGPSKDKPSEIQSTSSSFTCGSYTPSAFLPCSPALISATMCTLRFDLLMSLNEAKVDRPCVSDRIHRFVWGLDACVRNRRIDPRHASGLAYHLTVQRQRAKRSAEGTTEANSLDRKEEEEEQGGNDSQTAKRPSPTNASSGRSKSSGKSSASTSSKSGHKRGDTDSTNPSLCAEDGGTPVKKDTEKDLLERDMHMACRDPWVVYTVCMSLIRYTLNGLYEDKLPRDIPEVSLLVHFLFLGLGDDLNPPPACVIQSPNAAAAAGIKDRSGSSTSRRGSSPSEDDSSTNTYPKCMLNALVGHVLPAVAQLQVLTWRAQLAEEILASSNHLWPGGTNLPSASTSASSVIASAGATPRRTSVSSSSALSTDTREAAQPPSALQKQITDAVQSTSLTSLPPDYLIHPVGYLILQYHALFALERNELAVLRVLLKAAANAVQQQQYHTRAASRAGSRSTPTKGTGPASPPPASPSSSSSSGTLVPMVCFRWRPEVLQALVLGISRLPVSAPAFVDASRSGHRATGPDAPNLGDNGSQLDVVPNSTEIPGADHSVSVAPATGDHPGTIAVPGAGGGASGGSGVGGTSSKSGSGTGLLADSRPSTSTPMITRAELAMLLRASLSLVNDLNLLALAQIALLVPGPQTSSPGAAGTSGSAACTPLTPDASAAIPDPFSPSAPQLSDRERLMNVLARHCVSTGVSGASEATEPVPLTAQVTGSSSGTALTTGTTVYKSSNPRVLSALELLRRDIEKSLNPTSIPMTGGTSKSSSIYGGHGQQATPFLSVGAGAGSSSARFGGFHMPTAAQSDSGWAGATPRSPPGKYSRSSSIGGDFTPGRAGASYSTASHRFDYRNPAATPGSSMYYSSSASGSGSAALPIGTPLTNPGLMGGNTPNLNNLTMGSHGSIPSTPRRPSTPPREFLPPSPAISATNSNTTAPGSLSGFNLPSHLAAFTADFPASTSSCPSPSVHRTGGTHPSYASSTTNFLRPRSPSPARDN